MSQATARQEAAYARAQELSLKAIEVLAGIMNDVKENSKHRIAAAKGILDVARVSGANAVELLETQRIARTIYAVDLKRAEAELSKRMYAKVAARRIPG